MTNTTKKINQNKTFDLYSEENSFDSPWSKIKIKFQVIKPHTALLVGSNGTCIGNQHISELMHFKNVTRITYNEAEDYLNTQNHYDPDTFNNEFIKDILMQMFGEEVQETLEEKFERFKKSEFFVAERTSEDFGREVCYFTEKHGMRIENDYLYAMQDCKFE